MEVIFLGTAAMQPTKKRSHSAILVRHDYENILVDCGEGTQRQMIIMGLKPTKITRILISHWHGDHVIGLAGLINNLGANQYNGILEIYGPKGIDMYFKNITNSCIFQEKIKTKLIELKEGLVFENNRLKVEAFKLKHSCPCFGFNFLEKDKRKINVEYLKKLGLGTHPLLGELQRGKDIIWKDKKIKVEKATKLVPGKKLSILLDTGYSTDYIKKLKGADVLISEGTLLSDLKSKADLFKHLTVKDAASIAKKANVKKLVITHISQRYKDSSEVLKEAKSIFSNSVCAEDFMTLVV